MNSFNRIVLLGNLTKDPELKLLDGGLALAKMTLATNRKKKVKDSSEDQQVADFHNVVVWRKLAEKCAQYLKKGSPILIEGQLLQNRFVSKVTNEPMVRSEIVAEKVSFLSSGNKGAEAKKDAAKK